MRVLKFGGTSVGDRARILNACEIVRAARAIEPVVVVVSAASKVTDMLLRAAGNASRGTADASEVITRIASLRSDLELDSSLTAEIETQLHAALQAIANARHASPEALDLVASFGERISVRCFAAMLDRHGVRATAFDAHTVGMLTDDQFTAAEPLPESDAAMQAALGSTLDTVVPVVTGFIGRTHDGRITTLGRGGSDYSAALFGAALHANEIQIWTDVDGVMTSDPRTVPSAQTIATLAFHEAAELAYFGAKVLHPKTILPAVRKAIPVRVLNTFRPQHPGTVITELGEVSTTSPVRAIAAKKDITIVQMTSSRMLLAHGFLARVFDVFARHRIVVDLIATSEVSLSLSIDREDHLATALTELRDIADVQTTRNAALIAMVGAGIGDALSHVAGKALTLLANASINVSLVSAGSGRANLSVVIPASQCDEAVRRLHEAFFSSSPTLAH